MALSKIPVDLILTAGFIAMLTPPLPSPPKQEVLPSTTIDILAVRKLRLTIARVGQIILASAEIATIIAQANPSSNISQQVISTFILKQNQHSKISLNTMSTLGAVLWLSGAALRLQAFENLGRFFHFDISIQKEHKLIVTGPYSYVRHPSYSGLLLATIGWFLWYGAHGSWVRESGILTTPIGRIIFITYTFVGILPLSVVTLSRMSKEDEILRKQFGEEWDNWAKKVPYQVVPCVY